VECRGNFLPDVFTHADEEKLSQFLERSYEEGNISGGDCWSGSGPECSGIDNAGALGEDKSGNANTGTAQGNAAFGAGFLGDGALALDGAGDYMQLPNMGAEFTNSASLSVWVKPTARRSKPAGGSTTLRRHRDSCGTSGTLLR